MSSLWNSDAIRRSGKPLKYMLKVGIFALLIAAFLLRGQEAFAQFETAAVLGYVRDTSGAAVPNVKVTLTNVATNLKQSVKTDGEGKYEFSSVQIGDYQVSTEADGFDSTRTERFAVTTNARQRVDVTVRAGSVATTVEVTAAAQLLESETSSRGQVIGTREVESLPLNGRSYADLVLLVPGARKSYLENNGTSSREGAFNINGQRSAFNNFMLDGLDNNNYGTSNQGFANENIPPSPDAVSEFRVETNNYSAEYGRSSGAVINASVRRGTNQFHGRAWDYVRNTSLNSIGPFLAPGATKPKFIRNQFGGTFGGPIWKDKTFFFGDYEATRQIFNNASTTSTLPTANQRNGYFFVNDDTSDSTKAIPLQNPITGKTYKTGIIPTSDMTAFARAVLTALPTTTVSGLSNNFSITPRGTINDDKGDFRLDHTFNAAWTVFGRFSQHHGQILDPPGITGRAGGNSNGNTHMFNRDLAMGATWTISDTKMLDLRFGWSTNKGGKHPLNQDGSSMLVENGITDGLPTDPNVVRALNAQAVTGYTQFGAQSSNPQFQNPTVYNPKANFTWIRGRHSLKIGYEYQALNIQVNDFNPSYGQDTYANSYAANGNPANTNAVGSTLSAQLSQARNLADFMFGNRSSYALTNYTIVNLRQRYNFMYLQDDFKVDPSLTINAGIRYELATPQWERDNKLANFDPRTNTLIQASKGDIYNRALVNLPVKNFAPRFGFSYTVDPKTVLRAGYGISFTQWNRAGGENNLTYNGPNVVNATIPNPTPTPTSLCTSDTQLQSSCFRQTQQGYSQYLTSATYFNPLNVTTRYIPKNFSTGYVQSYHMGLQRELPGAIVAELSYVGSKSTHLQILGDYNQATPCVGTACGNLQARRPVSTFGSIEIAWGGGSANYNSLQFKLERRTRVGLYLLNSFTYSRGFDLSSGHLEANNGDNSRVNYNNPRQDYGPSGYDQPLADTTSIVYDLPFGHGRHFGANSGHLLNTALGGWQLTLINTMTSGMPVNISYSLASSSSLYGSSLVTYRPAHTAAGGPITASSSNRKKTSTTVTGYFLSTNLTTPTTAPWGNVSRNSERGFGYYQADLGLHKAFPLWNESSNFDFRAEAFNVLNKVNYMSPDGVYAGSTFGTISSAYPARQLQFAAKIIF